MLLLSGLILAWTWVLFNQFEGDPETDREAEAAPQQKAALIETIQSKTPKENQEKPSLSIPDQKTRKQQQKALQRGPGRDLFSFSPSIPEKSSEIPPAAPEKTAPAPAEPLTVTPVLRVTATFLGRAHKSAVVNGKRHAEGDILYGSTRIIAIGYGWIEVEDADHTRKRITINKQTKESEKP